MPDETKRAPDDEDADYRTDTFSRNDREGLPGPEVENPDVSASLYAGEEDGYDTDTFSRGDREGLPGVGETAGDDGPAQAKPDPLKVPDDADSRDASPPPVRDGAGGVR